jgi:hypothetical protein
MFPLDLPSQISLNLFQIFCIFVYLSSTPPIPDLRISLYFSCISLYLLGTRHPRSLNVSPRLPILDLRVLPINIHPEFPYIFFGSACIAHEASCISFVSPMSPCISPKSACLVHETPCIFRRPLIMDFPISVMD